MCQYRPKIFILAHNRVLIDLLVIFYLHFPFVDPHNARFPFIDSQVESVAGLFNSFSQLVELLSILGDTHDIVGEENGGEMFVFEILSKVLDENVEEEWGCLHSLGNSFGYGYFLFTVNSDA